MPHVEREYAELAWFLYDLQHVNGRYESVRTETVYTEYGSALNKMTTPEPGAVENFMLLSQDKLNEKLDHPPDAPALLDVPLQ